jgi:sugar (pentulose or hexulose) kinase
VISEACGENGMGSKITAFSISSFGEAVVPVTDNGTVLCPTFVDTETHSGEELNKILQKISKQEIQEITGLVPSEKSVAIIWSAHVKCISRFCKQD